MEWRHEENRKRWEITAPRWKARRDATGSWRKHHRHPENSLTTKGVALIDQYLGGVIDKPVVVLGSGDNGAAFALSGLGAKVTSVDISQAQLDIAAQRAQELGLANIEFHQGDIMALPEFADETFDFACSVGVVAIWITDLRRYYAEAYRILKPGGLFVIDEMHPSRFIFELPFEDKPSTVAFHYFDTGPKPYAYDPESGMSLTLRESRENPNNWPQQYESHWTVSDYVMALIDAGFELLHIAEKPSENLDNWRQDPKEAFPEDLQLIARKRVE